MFLLPHLLDHLAGSYQSIFVATIPLVNSIFFNLQYTRTCYSSQHCLLKMKIPYFYCFSSVIPYECNIKMRIQYLSKLNHCEVY